MEERRKLERFEIVSPARVRVSAGGDDKHEYNLTTRDVSSGGAFLLSSQHLPEGMTVRLEFLLSLDTLTPLVGDGKKARVRVKGEVVRSDRAGIAIRFDSSCKITALDNNGLH